MIRIYRVEAPSWFQASLAFRKAEEAGTLPELLTSDFVVADKPKSFWSLVKKQLLG